MHIKGSYSVRHIQNCQITLVYFWYHYLKAVKK